MNLPHRLSLYDVCSFWLEAVGNPKLAAHVRAVQRVPGMLMTMPAVVVGSMESAGTCALLPLQVFLGLTSEPVNFNKPSSLGGKR